MKSIITFDAQHAHYRDTVSLMSAAPDMAALRGRGPDRASDERSRGHHTGEMNEMKFQSTPQVRGNRDSISQLPVHLGDPIANKARRIVRERRRQREVR